MRPITVIALDPGLATFGLVVVRTNTEIHQCMAADVFIAPAGATRLDIDVHDDRVRRGKMLARWLEGHLTKHAPSNEPVVVAAESMSFPRGTHAIAAICIAWGVILDQVELRSLPMVSEGPRQWRRALTPSGKEHLSHRVAIKRVPSFAEVARRIEKRDMLHALDALGVACWSMSTNMVRGMAMAVAR